MKTSVWHWVISVFALLWFIGGAMDYVMVNYKVESYMAEFNAAELAFLDARPGWYSAAWGISIWGSFVGALALLARSKYAALLFFASGAGFVAACVHTYGLADTTGTRFNSANSLIFNAVIALSIIFAYLYARWQVGRGVLR